MAHGRGPRTRPAGADPTRFDPTRFLGGSSAELKRQVLPFGSGAHRCIGSALGELIAVEMVSDWVNRFDLRLETGRRGMRVTARPSTQPSGLRVRVVGRRDGTPADRTAAATKSAQSA